MGLPIRHPTAWANGAPVPPPSPGTLSRCPTHDRPVAETSSRRRPLILGYRAVPSDTRATPGEAPSSPGHPDPSTLQGRAGADDEAAADAIGQMVVGPIERLSRVAY